MKKWLFLVTAILMEGAASLALRAPMDHPAWHVLVGVGYTSAFVLISATLRLGAPIGVAYGIWAASGVALTTFLGAFLFRDPLTWTMGTGIVLIIGGVMLAHAYDQWWDAAARCPQSVRRRFVLALSNADEEQLQHGLPACART